MSHSLKILDYYTLCRGIDILIIIQGLCKWSVHVLQGHKWKCVVDELLSVNELALDTVIDCVTGSYQS